MEYWINEKFNIEHSMAKKKFLDLLIEKNIFRKLIDESCNFSRWSWNKNI